MDKKDGWQNLHTQFDQIPVPQNAVYAAIDRGIQSATHKRRWRKTILTVAAALMLETAGVVGFNPAASQAVSNAAWLSGFYLFNGRSDDFNTFHVQGVAKGLDQTVTAHGLTVHLVAAYYSGKTIGVTGEVTGMSKRQLNLNGEDEFSFALKPTSAAHFSNSSYDFQQTKDGYHFSLVFKADGKSAPEKVTLPVQFENLGGVAGRWNFKLRMTKEH